MAGMPAHVDEVLTSYLRNAYQAFVSDIDGVPDEEEIDVSIGDDEITLPSYVLKIKSAQLSDGTFLTVLNRSDARNKNLNARVGTPGELRYLIIGSTPNLARLAGQPVKADTITLDVDRLPKQKLAIGTTEIPDVSDVYQLDVVAYALAQIMLLNYDARINQMAQQQFAKYQAAVSDARKAKARAASKKTRIVNYGGY